MTPKTDPRPSPRQWLKTPFAGIDYQPDVDAEGGFTLRVDAAQMLRARHVEPTADRVDRLPRALDRSGILDAIAAAVDDMEDALC